MAGARTWIERLWRRGPPPAALPPPWPEWRALVACFETWRALVPSRAPGGWLGFDAVAGLRRTAGAGAALARLARLDAATVAALADLAELNVRRQELLLRSVILGYLTVPLTLAALWAQLSPAGVIASLADPGLAGVWAGTLAGLATAIVLRVAADWRARALVAVVRIAQIEAAAGRAGGPAAD